jgi:hypothetical protein
MTNIQDKNVSASYLDNCALSLFVPKLTEKTEAEMEKR